jgi:hypothetical protein
MRTVTVISVGFILGGLLLCQGCGTSVQTGPGVRASYGCETLRARMDYPIDDAYRAASDAVQQLDLCVLRHDQDEVAGEIYTLDAQRDTIAIEMEALPGERTLLTIRVDLFGNKNKSEVVFERIVENLQGEAAVARQ